MENVKMKKLLTILAFLPASTFATDSSTFTNPDVTYKGMTGSGAGSAYTFVFQDESQITWLKKMTPGNTMNLVFRKERSKGRYLNWVLNYNLSEDGKTLNNFQLQYNTTWGAGGATSCTPLIWNLSLLGWYGSCSGVKLSQDYDGSASYRKAWSSNVVFRLSSYTPGLVGWHLAPLGDTKGVPVNFGESSTTTGMAYGNFDQ